jgi:hypothetical protein
MKTLNQFSFHMGRMVRFEVEIPASVSGVSVDLCDQCCFFSENQNIEKGNRIVRLNVHGEADGRS